MKVVRYLSIWLVGLVFLAGCASEPRFNATSDRQSVEEILADLDDLSLSPKEQLKNYTKDSVILVPNKKEIKGSNALLSHLSDFGEGVDLSISHQIVEFNAFKDIVIVQGRVVGTAKPDNDPNTYPFETKNIILFKRTKDDELKIWKVIYNAAPVE